MRVAVVAGRRELQSPDMSRREVVGDEFEHGSQATVGGDLVDWIGRPLGTSRSRERGGGDETKGRVSRVK